MDDTETTIITKLQTSDLDQIHHHVATYLQPFTTALTAAAKPPSQTLIRPLAKKYLPFLNRLLSLLPKRITTLHSSHDPRDPSPVQALFSVYQLCLKCLDSISSELSGKPYSVCIQRLRMVSCFVACGLYKDAEDEGFSILESLCCRGSRAKPRKLKNRGYVPDPGKECEVGGELASIVVEIVVTLVKCAAMNESKDGAVYMRVLTLLNEVKPWFRVLDANACEKLQMKLVTYLNKCALFLVEDLMRFDTNLILTFCSATLEECTNLSTNEPLYKVSRRICSLVLSQDDKRSPVISDILNYVLDVTAAHCKIEVQNTMNEFLEIVSYCAKKCRISGTRLSASVATHLNKITGDFREVNLAPLDLILRIYAIGMSFTNSGIHESDGGSSTTKQANNIFEIQYLIGHEKKLHSLAALLGLLRAIFPISNIEKNAPLFVWNGDSADSTCSNTKFDSKKILVCKKNKIAYSPFYLSALNFTCQPLAEFVNLAKKHILVEDEDTPHFHIFCVLEEAFLLLGDVFFFCKSFTNEIERNGLDGTERLVFCGAIAAYTLSFRTKVNVKSNIKFIKHAISNGSSQVQELKYIFISLYNIGVILYRHNLVKGASKALKLSCLASWACVSLLCQTFVEKSKGFPEELSEAAVVDFVKDVSLKCAFCFEVLYQCAHKDKVISIFVDSLQKWTIAGKTLKSLPTPLSLINEWVKIECRVSRNEDEEYSAQTTYCLLSSSEELSKSTATTLLEQELQAYEEMIPKFPKFGKRMQIKIMGILSEDIYTTEDYFLQKAKILIKKGTVWRTYGLKFLKDCDQCFTKAISTIVKQKDSYEDDILVGHHLAVAHCLQALCKEEADPNSKDNFQDIRAALNAWLSMLVSTQCEVSDKRMMVSDMAFPLLYRIIDLLSLKGSIEFHHDIYKLMIGLFKWKKFPPEKCWAMLWKYRRLSHALCASPVNDVFILTLSKYSGELSINDWIGRLQMSPSLVLGFKLNFSFLFPVNNDCSYPKNPSPSQFTVDEVKQVASELISSDDAPSRSIFLAGHLFYDLCEELLATGRSIEALSFAKKAHQLRGKLFREFYSYSIDGLRTMIDGRKEDYCNSSEPSNNSKQCFIQISSSVATDGWSGDSVTGDMEEYCLTPWNVLQCYLESTLQVGRIHEIVGNCTEAEILLQWGKNISIAQGLPFFVVSFSSILGNLYRKKRQWDMGNSELQNAEKLMTDNTTWMSCLKCRLILEVTINQQFGDLLRNQFDNSSTSKEKLCFAEDKYKTALNKLYQSEWGNYINASKETTTDRTTIENYSHKICTGDIHDRARLRAERGRKPKKSSKQSTHEPYLGTEPCSRVTRSRSLVQAGIDESSNQNNGSVCVDRLSNRMSHLKVQSSAVDGGYKMKCTCEQKKYWQSSLPEILTTGLLNDSLHLKWEFTRRRLSLRLLTGIGKCCALRGEFDATHDAFLRSATILCCRIPFSNTHSSTSISSFLDVIGTEISGDMFSLERASVLYNFCWYSLKNSHSEDTRTHRDISAIQISKLFSWLLLAFVLCREAPNLFQKVSKLLAAVCLYVASSKSLSFPLSSCKVLSPSHYASFFHQASIGTHLNNQMWLTISEKHNAHCFCDAECSRSTCSHRNGKKTYNLLRLAPETLDEIDEFVTHFFESLPCVAVACLSLVGGDFARLLNGLLLDPSVCSWILISRLNSKSQPFVFLLPVNSILEDSHDDSSSYDSGNILENSCLGQWHCPWGSTVVDDVVPGFRSILQENYLSSSIGSQEDTKRSRSLWWTRRKKLDLCLGKLLRDMEDLWLGAYKYLLLGDWMDSKRLDFIRKKLALNLTNKFDLNVNESLLRVILGSASFVDDKEECVKQPCLYNGCYVGGRFDYDGKKKAKASSNACRRVECLSNTALTLLVEAVNELEQDEFLERQPIILVLDSDIQMLPWENLPILRSQEVYRMPSVGCITTALAKRCQCEEQSDSTTATFPFIDPLDAFYLLNPSGDLSGTQNEFEDWFKDQNLEGIAGKAPTIEDMSTALKSHDLFMYFGHGSGAQYIPGHEIQKLDCCAATLLMGCSSGSLSLSGCYAPQGIPISYLLAGSPVVVSNLWEVTDNDIDRFSKALLEGWMRERANPFSGYEDRPKIGSFTAEARKACILPFLNGAAPVCYGIPTGIRKKKDLSD